MLRIVVELVPGGRESGKRELARAELGNISHLADTSDYDVWAREGENPLAMTRPWESRSVITGHDRHQSVWALVAKAAQWAAKEAEKKARNYG